MQVKGKIHKLSATEQATATVRKRELILEYAENPQYPQYIKFEAINDKCDKLDSFAPGQEVEVYFNLNGREWTDKTGKVVYFNTLAIWKVEAVGGQAQYAPPVVAAGADDDLPF
jgi:hypothetical protein